MPPFFEYLLFGICVVFACFLAILYIKNFIKAVKAVNNKEYTVNTGLRVVGIFVFFVGIIMGAV